MAGAGNTLWWGNLLLGVGQLLPWNALLSAYDLWEVLFAQSNPQFMFIFSVCYNSMALPGLLLMLWLGPRVRAALWAPVFFGVNVAALSLLGALALIPGLSVDLAFYAVCRATAAARARPCVSTGLDAFACSRGRL